MNSRPKQPKYARNKNVLVIGGSGSGKTRFFVKPNLMQCSAGGSKNGENAIPVSYIVTDPKGTVLVECGKLLQRSGYRIKVLNTINFKKSMHYNPFAYIRNLCNRNPSFLAADSIYWVTRTPRHPVGSTCSNRTLQQEDG